MSLRLGLFARPILVKYEAVTQQEDAQMPSPSYDLDIPVYQASQTCDRIDLWNL